MPYNKEQLYATIVPRPRKVAFFINPNKCPNDLLNSIYEFSLSQWGGRYNPIIPVIDSKIDTGYWDLLKFSDPDIIYTYTWLNRSLINRIDKEISPFHLIAHKEQKHAGGSYQYRVDLHGQIAAKMLYPVFNNIFKQDPVTRPSLFIYNGDRNSKDYRSILRNFGIINDTALVDKIPQEISQIRIEQSSDLSYVVKKITETRAVVTPMQLAENSAFFYDPEYDRSCDSFFIYIGDNIWNWLHCWNRNIILSRWRRSQILQICLSPESFNSEIFRNNLCEFLSYKFWSSSDRPGTIYFTSNVIKDSELKKLSSLMPRKGNFFFAEQCIDTKTFPRFKVIPRDAGLLKNGKQIQLSGEHVLLQNISPTFLRSNMPDTNWMLDFMIAYRPEKFTYTNINYWWKLPKRSGVTSLFFKGIPGRITNDGLISIQASSNMQNLELSIPKDRSVIQSYIFTYYPCFYTDDLRSKQADGQCKKDIKKSIRISDKGGYTRGVVDMFSNLFEATQFIENRFWRNTITNLCNIDLTGNENYLVPIINRIEKRIIKFKAELQNNPEEAKKWLANFIYNKAKEIRMSKAYISFSNMMNMLKRERLDFLSRQQNHRGFDISTKTNENDLKDSLRNLVVIGVFEQGLNITCSFCGTTFWYGIEELKKETCCKGCRTSNQAPIEANWTYKLNELFKNAIEFHGVLSSIWALGEILPITGSSFIYTVGLEMHKKYESKRPYGELDLACIVDGKFIIGEVKTSSNDLGEDELRIFVALCKEIKPQKVAIFVLKDPTNRLRKIVDFLDKELKVLNIEVAGFKPGSNFSEPAYHI